MNKTVSTFGNQLAVESALNLNSVLLSSLEQAISLLSSRLEQFANDEAYAEKMAIAFGISVDENWQVGDLSSFPHVEIVTATELNGANGAYAIAQQRIYLSYEFLSENLENVEAITSLLLEEYGHYLDGVLNVVDTPGDEGAIFAALVMGESLSDEVLGQLKSEDDTGFININGEEIFVEMQNFTGTAENDTIVGTSGDDVIYGLGGNDSLSGLEGNDTINPGLGYDLVDGGDGNDLLIVNYSNNSISSFGIISPIIANSSGGFSGAYRGNTFDFDATVFFSNIERFDITASRGNDNITTGGNNDTINGGGGNDTINGGGGNDILNGDSGNDIIYGQDGNDRISGNEGDDFLDGGAGNDTIEGGIGNDIITQGSGVNIVDGGDGFDTLVDGNFSSLTNNQNFNDSGTTYPTIALADGTTISNIEYFTNLTTGIGNDTVNFTRAINNIINTGLGNDTINLGLGYDFVDGGNGDDLLIVNYSNNSISSFGVYNPITPNGSGGFSGAYIGGGTYDFDARVFFSNIERFDITASRGNDNIITGGNNDVINGYGGIDTISAGGGADKIILADAVKQYYDDLNTTTTGTTDYANIIGFETQDIIQLAGSASLYRLNVVGSNTELYLDKPGSEPDELIGLFQGVTNLSLTSDNFIYVQPVNLSVSTSTGTEAGTTVITVTATTLSPVLRNQSVNLTVSGSVTSADYTLSSNTIIIPDGSNTGSVTFTVVDDTLIEPTETATLTLTNPSSGLVLGSTTSRNITIINDDFPFVNLSVSSNTGTEAATTVITVTATASSPVLSNQSVNLAVTGTGITPGDYTLSNSVINIPSGGTTGTITFTVVNDTLVEGPETATISINSISSGLLLGSTTSQSVTITDNDFPRVNLSVSSNTGSEAGTTIITVTASASDPVIGNQSVDLAITGTGVTPGDYNLSNSTITLLNGQTTGTATFTVIDDDLIEPTETATLTLTNPSSGLVLGSTISQNITIINDDFPLVNLSVSSNTGTEAETTIITVTATTTNQVLGNQTVDLAITGTGITPGDYNLSNSTITILDGQTTGTVTFTVADDTLVEGTETAILTLTNPSSGLVLGSTISKNITLTDNDFAPPEDGNFDGIPDEQQDNVISLPALNNQYVTFATPLGQPSVTVETTPNPDPANTPANVDFSLGFFAFNVPQVTPGGATTITLFLPAGTTANSYWKYGPTPNNPTPHWYNFTFDSLTNTGATFQDINSDGQNEIILNLVDGQRGDDDLTANGQISDPGAPAFLRNSPPTAIQLSNNSVSENAHNNALVGRLTTLDPDPGDRHSYQLLNAAQVPFSLTQNEVRVTGSLDYETQTSYQLQIRSTDQDGLSLEQTLTINIQDDRDFNITGTSGDDIIVGGIGGDLIRGNGGKDIFRYRSSREGGDTIVDFNPFNDDRFDLSAIYQGGKFKLGATPFNNYIQVSQINSDVLIRFAPFANLAPNYFLPLARLENVNANTIDASDFIFS